MPSLNPLPLRVRHLVLPPMSYRVGTQDIIGKVRLLLEGEMYFSILANWCGALQVLWVLQTCLAL